MHVPSDALGLFDIYLFMFKYLQITKIEKVKLIS